MKICVYAIAKNEAKFAARWAASMGEADEKRFYMEAKEI